VLGYSAIHSEPDRLPGSGGAFLRCEGDLPDNAIWLPAPNPSRLARRGGLALGGGAVAVACTTLLVDLLPFTDLIPLLLSALMLLAAVDQVRRHPRPARGGRRGLLLLADHVVFDYGDHCGIVMRSDVTGVERRVHPIRGVHGAFTLAARTGRGALPSPIAGDTALAELRQWLHPAVREPSPPEA